MKKIFLFDIDGTLMHIKKEVIRGIIADLVRQYTPSVSLEELADIPFAGRTDRAIFEDLLRVSDQPVSHFDDIKRHYIEALYQKLAPEHLEIYEPIYKVLDYCQSHNIPTGLLTGNFREIATLKTRLAGMEDYFNFGAFGCDHPQRNALPEIARKHAGKHLEREVAPEELVLIGDTPNDIEAARFGNSKSVAVATGSYSYEQLKDHNPDLLLYNLSRPENWVSQILEQS